MMKWYVRYSIVLAAAAACATLYPHPSYIFVALFSIGSIVIYDVHEAVRVYDEAEQSEAGAGTPRRTKL
jgi:hypothetical protein